MAENEEAHRTRDEDPAPDEQSKSQEELDRTSRATGGDAPAAGSIEEREAVAEDEDELFDGGEDRHPNGSRN